MATAPTGQPINNIRVRVYHGDYYPRAIFLLAENDASLSSNQASQDAFIAFVLDKKLAPIERRFSEKVMLGKESAYRISVYMKFFPYLSRAHAGSIKRLDQTFLPEERSGTHGWPECNTPSNQVPADGGRVSGGTGRDGVQRKAMMVGTDDVVPAICEAFSAFPHGIIVAYSWHLDMGHYSDVAELQCKRSAGHLLDGVEWQQVPEIRR